MTDGVKRGSQAGQQPRTQIARRAVIDAARELFVAQEQNAAPRRGGNRKLFTVFRWAEVRGLSFADGSSPFAGSDAGVAQW